MMDNLTEAFVNYMIQRKCTCSHYRNSMTNEFEHACFSVQVLRAEMSPFTVCPLLNKVFYFGVFFTIFLS